MILIDMQGYQSLSKNRGIGRYTFNFVKTFLKQNKDTYLLFNNSFKDTKKDKEIFSEFVGKDKMIEFSVSKKTPWLEKVSELTREKLISDLNPEAVIITSLFEGIYDSSITSIKKFYNIPTAVIFYDLIPLIQKEMFFKNQLFKEWYLEKLENLKKADLLLAISNSARNEAIKYLNFDKNRVINISSAIDINHEKEDFEKVKRKFNINKEYIMHVSACDERKNFEGLIKAFGKTNIKNNYQLVFVCNANKLQKTKLLSLAKAKGCLLYTSPSPRDGLLSRMPSSA
jgi:glycosyltransferase involved in cell wall biosynthesis